MDVSHQTSRTVIHRHNTSTARPPSRCWGCCCRARPTSECSCSSPAARSSSRSFCSAPPHYCSPPRPHGLPHGRRAARGPHRTVTRSCYEARFLPLDTPREQLAARRRRHHHHTAAAAAAAAEAEGPVRSPRVARRQDVKARGYGSHHFRCEPPRLLLATRPLVVARRHHGTARMARGAAHPSRAPFRSTDRHPRQFFPFVVLPRRLMAGQLRIHRSPPGVRAMRRRHAATPVARTHLAVCGTCT